MKRILGLDVLISALGLFTQWLGAHYAHRHGLGSWYFGIIPFLTILSVAYVLVARSAFRASPSLRVRILISSCGLWVLTILVALGLWLNIYGS